ncbi:hypothetical protein X777_07253 [Ooceraea biroi]|uniref:Uncharacterized protein n=1 Tax=Ooceraea biroi TaxID=2015173 RepID=A0A026WAJ0_OOCBI|nr:hypothetical protein X777_07253 [Ooceraea biroi]
MTISIASSTDHSVNYATANRPSKRAIVKSTEAGQIARVMHYVWPSISIRPRCDHRNTRLRIINGTGSIIGDASRPTALRDDTGRPSELHQQTAPANARRYQADFIVNRNLMEFRPS